MLKVLVVLLIMLSLPLGNSSDIGDFDSRIEDSNGELGRVRAAGTFNDAALENTTVYLQDDSTVYEFFTRKKGKKYKVKNGQCTLGQLRSFSSYLQEDFDAVTAEIESLVVEKKCLTIERNKVITPAYAQFINGEITEENFYKIRSAYEVKKAKIENLLSTYSSSSLKLKDVIFHVDSLISKTKK